MQVPSPRLIHDYLSQDIQSRFNSIVYALDSGRVDSLDYEIFINAYNSDSVFYNNLSKRSR